MSINSLYEMSRRSFRAIDAAMNVTGQNIANVGTDGYSRKRLTLQADSPVLGGIRTRLANGISVGGGVSVAAYERLRDGLLDRASWEAHGALGSSQEEQRILSALEALFPSSGSGSLGGLLNDFWNAWTDLADHPTDNGIRLTVRSRADALTTTMNRMDGELQAFRDETGQVLTEGVKDINALLQDIASLNTRIREAEFRGSPDLEAWDRRDQIVQELAAFVPIKVQEKTDGYVVSINGMTVVQGDRADVMAIEKTGGSYRVVFGDTGVAYPTGAANDGRLGAWLRTLNTTIPQAAAELDKLAAALVTGVNERHIVFDDVTGARTVPAFFDESGVSAAAIRLSDAVLNDPSRIAPPGYITADGEELAFAIAALRGEALVDTNLDGVNDETAEHFVINFITGIGAQVRQASSRATAQTVVVDHLGAMGAAVSGVSLEEEMTNLIRFQQAYSAAARVLTTTEEMMDTLLAM